MLAGMCLTQTAAQENLLANKPIHTLGDAKTWTAGDASYTFITDDLTKLVAVPANSDNVYLYPENGTLNTEENRALGIQGFYVDMEASQAVGTVTTTWEGAAANAYSIWVTDEEPSIAILDTDATYSANGLGQYQSNTAVLPDGTLGRYIVFQATDATNYAWGVKIRSISAMAPVKEDLASFTVSPSMVLPGTPTDLTFSFANQHGMTIAADKVTVTAADNATLTGNNLTVSSGNKTTLSATYGETVLTADIYVLNVAPVTPDESDIKTPVYTNAVTEYNNTYSTETAYNGGAKDLGEITFGNGNVAHAYGDTRCVFFANTASLGIAWNGDLNPAEKGFGALHLDIYGTKDVNGNVVFEQPDTNHPFTLTAGEWSTVEVDLAGTTNIHTFSIRFDEANASDLLVANIYFTPAEIAAAPVPSQKSDEVFPIFGHYDAETLPSYTLNDGAEASTVNDANGNSLLFISNFTEAEFNALNADFTDFDNIHIDIYSNQDATLTLIPVWDSKDTSDPDDATVTDPTTPARKPARAVKEGNSKEITLSAGKWTDTEFTKEDLGYEASAPVLTAVRLNGDTNHNIGIDNLFLWNGTITSVEANISEENALVDVYSIQGTPVRRNVKAAAATEGLKAGLYIINGKKYIVK